MNRQSFDPPLSQVRRLIALAIIGLSVIATASAQTTSNENSGNKDAATAAKPSNDPMFEGIYQKFYSDYRLGPGDSVAVRIKGQPEYSKDQVKVSPVGSIYLDLLGDVTIAGMTLDQAREYLTKELSEYLKDPKVSISLIEAQSAKIGVLGEVLKPGIVVMARPMTVLDAITESGGFATTGSKSNVEVIRQSAKQPIRVNVDNILKGKARPEDNLQLHPGDLVIVKGNAIKTIGTITALAGFGNFTSFITLGRGR